MGLGTNILIIIFIINIGLFIAYPSVFTSGTEMIERTEELGINMTYEGELNSTNITGHIIISNDTSNTTELNSMIGLTEGSGVLSYLANAIELVEGAINFVKFLVKFAFAPITVMNEIPNCPWQLRWLIGIPMAIMYIIAILQVWTGRVF